MFWFVVLLLIAGAGFYFYQKLVTIEREIRAEQKAEKARATGGQTVAAGAPSPQPKPLQTDTSVGTEEVPDDPPIVSSEVKKMAAKAAPVPDEGMNLEDEVMAAVNNLPGIKQTDLYTSFPDVDRKKLQQLLRELAGAGRLRREKVGSSYLLHPR